MNPHSTQTKHPFMTVPFLLMVATILTGAAATTMAEEKTEPAWGIQKNDRVVFLGSTFIERENNFGMIEMSLRVAFPETQFSTRNLGWSGDNVLGESRAYFGPVKQGYAHLQEYIKLTDPTILFVSYGHNAAFEGEKNLKPFLEKYGKLLDDLKAENRKIVVLGLTPLEASILSVKEATQFNNDRRTYDNAIEKMCVTKQIAYIELLNQMVGLQKRLNIKSLTTNSVHLNQLGYAVTGEVILNSLGRSLIENDRLLLSESQFQSLSQPLRQEVLRKNELFFHRFRPENEIYLRGYRKHEQGQNAKEIYEFDAIIDEQEKKLFPLTQALNKARQKQ